MTMQIAKFKTVREAREFAGSLGSIDDWYSHIYKGHREYVVQYAPMSTVEIEENGRIAQLAGGS